MPNELIKEKIVLDKKIDKELSQLLLEGDIIVPDIKPDMSIILQSDAKVVVTKIEVSNDRINFMGRLDLSILYLAKGIEKPVHSISISTHIDDFINMEGVTKEMWSEVKLSIANVDYKMINDRKINYRAVVDVLATCENEEVHEIVVNIDDIDEKQCLRKYIDINRIIENKEDKFIVKDEIHLPSGKSNMREILQCNVGVSTKDVKVLNGKVSTNGELLITFLYKSDSDDKMIEFLETEIPFNGTIDVLNAKEDMFADIYLNVQDQYLQIRPDADGEDRLIEIEVSLQAIVKVSSQINLNILEDTHIINKNLDIKKKEVKYQKLVCKNKNQTPVKEIIQLSNSCPDMLQIFRVKGVPSLDDVKISDDKVIVQGVINIDILYVAEDDNTPIYSFRNILPYKQIIETKGSLPNMDVNINVNIDHIGFNMLSGKEVEVRILLSFNTSVFEEKTEKMICDIEFSDLDKNLINNMSSITIYHVQKNDTLWKIAKNYNTTIEELSSLNNIDDSSIVAAGQKLIILKKITN